VQEVTIVLQVKVLVVEQAAAGNLEIDEAKRASLPESMFLRA